MSHSERDPAIVIAQKYLLDDLRSATSPGCFLTKTLNSLENHGSTTHFQTERLKSSEFKALYSLAKKHINFEEYLRLAAEEQQGRYESKEKKQKSYNYLKSLSDQTFAKIAAQKKALESDPKYIAKVRNRELRESYNIDWFVDKDDFPRLMSLLKKVDNGKRLSDKEVIWLKTACDDVEGYFTHSLKLKYHENEATFYENDFHKTGNPWSIINASSHYRKCEWPDNAISLLKKFPHNKLNNKKVKCAHLTTSGGVMRDLCNYTEALSLAEKAHNLCPNDFRPCTLLGAVNIEMNRYELGYSWYKKAYNLGATKESIDNDLKQILRHREKQEKEVMCRSLLAIDPQRFKWVKDYMPFK